jgi:hypothetical protein
MDNSQDERLRNALTEIRVLRETLLHLLEDSEKACKTLRHSMAKDILKDAVEKAKQNLHALQHTPPELALFRNAGELLGRLWLMNPKGKLSLTLQYFMITYHWNFKHLHRYSQKRYPINYERLKKHTDIENLASHIHTLWRRDIEDENKNVLP